MAKYGSREWIKARAESSLEAFGRLILPNRVFGDVHVDIMRWWNRDGAKSHQMVLLPRDHQKSFLIALRAVWEITRNPAIKILYMSSTSNLATKQLKLIKDILLSPIYRKYWPEMVHDEESKREKWTESEISVDHPKRKEELIRDPTVFTAGLTTSIIGMHCDINIMDDIVVWDNASTEDGREKTKTQFSLLSSVESTDSRAWIVGTPYHPKDLYAEIYKLNVPTFDSTGEITGESPLYEIYARVVEDSPHRDGTGEFLWPRQQRDDGKWFGFDQQQLAKKKVQYLDTTQFYAQYYLDPNDTSNSPIKRDWFQYYDRKHLSRMDGKWHYRLRRLNIFAAVDFAYSLDRKADYTAIVVVGVDSDQNFYILDIDRFKTDEIGEYFNRILRLHQKWDFRMIRAETTAAQQSIVKSLKIDHIRKHGLALSIDEYKPSRHEGNKLERITSILQPKYQNLQMWHFDGGLCETLEEELTMAKPPHDDIKDCLAAAVDIARAPAPGWSQPVYAGRPDVHPRFGGII